ncbi:tetratricopeptide repeat protein [Nocardiopsis sp. CNS-639]|uniref:tetratricopeptide repeat protein n=1 Tax=Nocardiopsis sp. CNS-639 TaxID=1169153 RepID=UPI0003A7D834|nr:tetratricopeptide repeat protein [Nocardiopsis sp. CNS-639]
MLGLDLEEAVEAAAKALAESAGSPVWKDLSVNLANVLARHGLASERQVQQELDDLANQVAISELPEQLRFDIQLDWKIRIILLMESLPGENQASLGAELRKWSRNLDAAELEPQEATLHCHEDLLPDSGRNPEIEGPDDLKTTGQAPQPIAYTPPTASQGKAKWQERGGTHNTLRDLNDGQVFQFRENFGTIHQQIHRHDHTSDVVTARSSLPPAPAGFTGREAELATLQTFLAPGRTSPFGDLTTCSVSGMGGIGKTALALIAAHDAYARGLFSSAIFIDLCGYNERPVQTAQALDAMLRALGVRDTDIPPTLAERAALYRSRLNAIMKETGAPVLIVADNVSASQEITPLLPGGSPHRMLVTSRETLHTLPARNIDLRVLSLANGARLLDSALRIHDPSDDRITNAIAAARDVVELCGALPLALQIAAALLRRDPDKEVTELAEALLAALTAVRSRLGELDDGQRAIRPAFDVSFHRLDPREREVFQRLSLSPGPDLSTTAAAVLTGCEEHETRESLRRLASAHLIGRGASDQKGRWSFHDLVRDYATERRQEHAHASPNMAEADAAAERRLFGFYQRLTEEADRHLSVLPGNVESNEFSGREAALAWLDAERANLVSVVAHTRDSHSDTATHLSLHLAEYLQVRRLVDDAVTVSSIACETARDGTGEANEAHALNNLGIALRQSHRFEEAIEPLTRARHAYREQGDRLGEAVAWNNLGNTFQELQRLDEATAAHSRAQETYRQLNDHRGEATASNNLGNTLQRLRRFDEAIAAHSRARETYRRLGDHRGEAAACNNLGNALRQANRPDEAITVSSHARDLCQGMADHHGEADALNNLGLTLVQSGRFEEAATSLEQARDAYRHLGDRRGEAAAELNLGIALQQRDGEAIALTVYRRALEVYRSLKDPRGEAAAWNHIGGALAEISDLAEARKAHGNARDICHTHGDPDGEADSLLRLGTVLYRMGSLAEAVDAFSAARGIYQSLGNQQREFTTCLNISAVLMAEERVAESAAILSDASSIAKRIVAAKHREGETVPDDPNSHLFEVEHLLDMVGAKADNIISVLRHREALTQIPFLDAFTKGKRR